VNRETEITEAAQIPTLAPPPGSMLLGRYQVEQELGCGATSVVVSALDTHTNERVAIKIWRPDVELDSEAVMRFVREAQAAANLRSEHVARVRDAGCAEDGRPYIVLELLEGRDLGRILAEQGTLDPRRAVDLILQACDALAEAHANGIVHRDIKPTNLFVTRKRDGSERVAVLDFGISKAPPGGQMLLTQTASLLGTPAYMSLEQMRSPKLVDPRTDIWALGIVLYEAVEGAQPFDGRTFAQLCVSVATMPPRTMTRAPALEPVIARCLAKDLGARYQNVGELAAALAPFATDMANASNRGIAIRRVLGIEEPRPVRRSSPSLPQRASSPALQPDPRGSSPSLPRDPRASSPSLQPPPPNPLSERTAQIERSGPSSLAVIGGVFALIIAVAAAMYFLL